MSNTCFKDCVQKHDFECSFGALIFVPHFLSFPQRLQIMNQRSIILFPTEDTLKEPKSPQCLEYIIQYLIGLGDDESMSERQEAVVVHGCTFCMSLPNILLEAYLHLKVSSC